MVSPPEQPDDIRCGNCGTPNPPDAALCQHCGANLQPVTTPDEPVEGISPEESVEGAMSRSPTSPLNKPEPDFVFGGAGEGQEVTPTPDSEQAPGDAIPQRGGEPSIDEALGWLSEGEQTPRPAADMPPPPQPPADDVPPWLSEFDEPGLDEPPEQAEGAPDEELPGWLAELQETSAGKPPRMAAPPESEEEREEPPDWLRELQGAQASLPGLDAELPGEAASEAEQEPTAGQPVPPPLIPTGRPAWLRPTGELEAEIVPPEGSEEPLAEGEPPPPADEEAALDWLADLEEPQPEASVVEAEPPSPTEEAAPGWLADLGEPQPEPPAARGEPPPPADEEAVPGWLADLGEPQPEPPAEPGPAVEPAPDWMDALSFEEGLALPADAGATPGLGDEDLLGLSGDLFAPAAEEQDEASEAGAEQAAPPEAGELPPWLRGLRDEPEAPAQVEEAGAPDEGLLEQIRDLRFEAIAGEVADREAASPETVGALKDVTGVIQPELIFEGSSLSASKPVEALVITEEQVAQIETIRKLLAREATGVALAGRAGAGVPLLRWLVALALIVAIGAPLLPLVQAISPLQPGGSAPGVGAAFDALDALSARQASVVVAFEYEPDAAAELQPLAEAVLEHLAGMQDVTVYTVSTWPTGPAMADAVLRLPAVQPRLAASGGTWVNLGYLAGRANGVSNLAVGPPPGVPSSFAADYLGQPTGIDSARLIGGPFDMLIVLAARPEDLRMWIEQAGQPTGLPVVAGLSVRAAPLAEPYRQSGQITAALSGINDAVAYRARAGQEVASPLLGRWNAQAAGSAVAAALIVLGALVYGLWPGRAQQEQDR